MNQEGSLWDPQQGARLPETELSWVLRRQSAGRWSGRWSAGLPQHCFLQLAGFLSCLYSAFSVTLADFTSCLNLCRQISGWDGGRTS